MKFDKTIVPRVRRKVHYLASRVEDRVRFSTWKWRTYLTSRQAAHLYDVNRTYWLSPDEVRLALGHRAAEPEDLRRQKWVPPHYERGKIRGGDWDLEAFPFEELDVWKAFEHRFVRGGGWQETAFYKRILRIINAGITRWNCRTQEDLDARMRGLDQLLDEIRDRGYRSQDHTEDASGPFGAEDEIHVHIGRHGDYVFADGRHRLCIAKILRLDKVPVKVARRHTQWVRFRHEIMDYAKRQRAGQLYAAVLHPDIADVPAQHGHERMAIIKENLPGKTGTMLDIGAHWGYFCHCFEEVGFRCTAVEDELESQYFLEKLKRAQNRAFKILKGNVLELECVGPFDVVLALNVFHHFLKQRRSYERLIQFLRGLKAQTMFFEPHLPDEPQMVGSYRNYAPGPFVDFVLFHSAFRSATHIGRAPDGRPLFKLGR